jgi:ABC-type multidrug transport system fused ATPase/permease subunit
VSAAQEGLRPGRDASFLSRVFDGAGLAGPAGETPDEPLVLGGEGRSDPDGPILSEPESSASAAPRSRLAVLREMVLGQPEVAPLVRPYRLQMNLARAMLILKAVLSTGLAYSVGALVDAAIAHSLPAAGMWLGAVAALTVVKAVNQRFYSVTSGKLRIRVRRDFRIKLFAGLVGLSDPEESSGRLAARLTSDVARVTVKNVTIPIQFPHLVIQFALATAFVVKASPLMAGVMLGVFPLLGWLAWRYGRRSSALQERAATESAAVTQAGAKALAEAPLPEERRAEAVARYERKAGHFEKTMLELIGLGANFDTVRELLQAAATELLILGVGLTSFILTGAPTVGQVMSLRGYAKDLRGAVDGLVDAYTNGKEAEGGTRRILELLRRVQAPPADSGGGALTRTDGT